ncbi:MAG: prepilin-type N-terminal cleavage/methylation domain-containing protein [Patescibacteria group bacterium]
MRFLKHNRSGQSLAEVLVATTITAILVVAAVALISPVIRNDKYVGKLGTSTALSRELLENVKTFTASNWHNISDRATSSLNKYYLITNTSPFQVTSGSSTVIVASTTYTTYFYVDEARRDITTKNVTTTLINSTIDPATLIVTVVTTFPDNQSSTVSQILTRFQNSVFIQSDWSGGEGAPPTTSSSINQFVTGSNINTTSTPGSIILNNL